MIKVKPQNGTLLIRKFTNTALSADIVVEETDDDKRLIAGEVVSNDDVEYPKGTTVVFGKYALYEFTLQGEQLFFLSKDDVIATSDYTEKKSKK